MFAYIRWFAGISFVIVVLLAVCLGQAFKQIASEDLRLVVEDNNTSLAQGFSNTTWKEYRNQILSTIEIYKRFRASGVPVEQWKGYRGFTEMLEGIDNFSLVVFKHFENMPIVEVSIYMPDGTRLISTNQSRIIAAQGGSNSLISASPPMAILDDGTFTKAMTGDTVTAVMRDQPFIRPDGKAVQGVLVKTLFPIRQNPDFASICVNCAGETKDKGTLTADAKAADKNPVEAIIEIRYDVTHQWKRLELFQQIGMWGVIFIYAAVILVLLYTSSRSEAVIAKQHEANIELAAQAASAQAENRDKSQFLANISHELRTPLNAIIGFSEFIKSERSGPIGNEKYSEYVRDIHGSGVHLLSLINDILDYSKAEADKLELEISEVDATKSITNSIRLVSPRAETAQVQLIEEIPRDHIILKTDAKKLKQVMLNLLSNAVKFTPSGGSVTVKTWQNLMDGTLSIEVRDTGIGIAPKDISRAMAPFGQVDNTLSRKYEGTGLGLPLTRKFVEIMGGTFNIASEVGKGTTITITLPKESKGRPARGDVES